jgi:uncharacterized membrane protein
MAREKTEQLILTWLAGGFFLLLGVWIVSNLELNIGVSWVSYVFALLISFVLFLVAGLCWVTVSVGVHHPGHN